MEKGKSIHIVTECYTDTLLVEVVAERKGVNHQSTCSQVAATIEKKFKDSFAIGVIDADKRQPNYVLECREIVCSDELTLVKHPDRHHYFIKINHVMENCIIHAAEEIGFDLSAKGFPPTKEELMKLTKHKSSLENPQLRELFRSLRSSTTMKILHETISYLFQHPYNADENELKRIFTSPRGDLYMQV